jgi:NADH-quinone oxidoreductase subunit M
MILGAVYMLWMVQRVFFGELKHDENRNLKDMTGREVLVMLPLVIMMFVMGVITRPFTDRMSRSVNEQIVERVARAADNSDELMLAGSARTETSVESKP